MPKSQFETLYSPFTLIFYNRKLEDYYQRNRIDSCLLYFSPFYLILITITFILCTTIYMGLQFLSLGQTKPGWYFLIGDSLLAAGMILEIIVNLIKKLQMMRCVLLSICIFISTALANCSIMTTPTVRLGSVGLLLIATMDCIVYSYNWLIGSAVVIVGDIIWVLFFVDTFATIVPSDSFTLLLVNFSVAIWVVPFLLYWSEKKARQNAFLQWSSNKVFLSGIIPYFFKNRIRSN